MRIACIYWFTKSVGGIATHLNTLRAAAIRNGDTFDILHSLNWKRKVPQLFPERKWVHGGDTCIWVDGEIPTGKDNAEESARWLEQNYDAVVFGFICPHKRKDYPEPEFVPVFDCKLPKVAYVMDGYWEEYAEWAEPLLPKLDAVLCPLESYAAPLKALGVNVVISPFPFKPRLGKIEPRATRPLLIWPNQWKEIKGVSAFIESVPKLPKNVDVELYSTCIRYFQLRHEQRWRDAVGKDLYAPEYSGQGRATYIGNVDLPEIAKAMQRAWYTVNLQGMKARKETYKTGSYNNTEVEALFYGACPILHESTLQTDLPKEVFAPVASADDIPEVVRELSAGWAVDPKRQRLARDFVLGKHYYINRYEDLRGLL